MNPVRSALLAQVLYNHFLPETDTRLLKKNGKLKFTKIFIAFTPLYILLFTGSTYSAVGKRWLDFLDPSRNT